MVSLSKFSYLSIRAIKRSAASVVQDGKSLKINDQLYSVIVNERNALDIETLKKKYDPYLDQYDYLVGDVSSEHLRLKGFYKDAARTSCLLYTS